MAQPRLDEARLEEIERLLPHGALISEARELVAAFRVERERAEQAIEALREAVEVIEKLHDQQAMPDDWYELPLAKFRVVLAEQEKEQEAK